MPFVSRHYPPEKQGFALGVYGAGNIGTAIAARLSPQIANTWGRPAVFLVFAALIAGMALIFWLLARDAPAPANAPQSSFSTSLTVLRSERMAWLFSVFYFVTFGGFVAFALYLPKLLVDLYGITPLDAGNRVFVFVLLATIGRPLGGWSAALAWHDAPGVGSLHRSLCAARHCRARVLPAQSPAVEPEPRA